MALELYIFDWSGVISDDRKPVYETNMKILEAHGIPRVPFEGWFETTVQTAPEYLSKKGINKDYFELMKLYEEFYEKEIRNGNRPKIYPEVKDILKHFKDKRKDLAVLSSHPHNFLIEEAKKYKTNKFFDIIYGGLNDKVVGLETIHKILDHKAEETAYIGDTIYDIRSSKKLNLVSIAVCGGYHSKEMLEKEEPRYLLENLSNLRYIN